MIFLDDQDLARLIIQHKKERDGRIGFFDILSTADMESVLGQSLRNRVRDKFRSIQPPLVNT